MDSRVLECFLRVAELGSINRAAVDLNLSQPALSRQIAGLEHEMQVQLFIRSQGGVRLTEAGKLLSDRVRPLLRQFAVIKAQVGERAAGLLAIGIPPSWHGVFTSSYLATLLRDCPNVSLKVFENVSHILRDQLLAGALDLAAVPFEHTPPNGYRQTLLLREPLVVVGNQSAHFEAAVEQPAHMLDQQKLLLPGRPNALRMQIENSLQRRGLKFSIGVETDTLRLCMELTRQGAGLTVVPACAVYQHNLGENIKWAPLKGMYLTWALFENEARSHSPAVQEGRRLFIETLKTQLAQGHWFGAEAVGTAR